MTVKNKIALSAAIQEMIQRDFLATQEELCSALKKRGIIVNQVRVSRILNQLGAIKMNENGKTVYRLPSSLPTLTVSPSKPLRHLIINISANESTILIQTSPGSAQLVAGLLDQQVQQLEILGCVAGDDTIFIAPQSTKQIKKTKKLIEAYFS